MSTWQSPRKFAEFYHAIEITQALDLVYVRIEYQFPTKQRDALLDKYHVPAVEGIEHFGDSNNMVIFRPTEIHSTI